MTVAEAVLKGEARAWGWIADRERERGGTYESSFARVRAIFEKAGRPAPTREDFEDKMAECDELESR